MVDVSESHAEDQPSPKILYEENITMKELFEHGIAPTLMNTHYNNGILTVTFDSIFNHA
jgi:hypothetical protein